MEVKKSTLQNIGTVLLVILAVIGGLVFLVVNKKEAQTPNTEVVSQEDGKQIINLTAKAGYSPKVIEAKANQETILRVSTNNTFDCSSVFRIPELGVQKNLPATGETDFVIEAQEPGSEINGTCGMGMYRFNIKFV